MTTDRPETAEIKSVSSGSQNDEEVATLSSDSSSGGGGADSKVRPAVLVGTAAGQQGVVPDFDEPKVAPSPAPAPTQGGEDEVIRVSHVRKIQIKTNSVPEAPPPLKLHKAPPVASRPLIPNKPPKPHRIVSGLPALEVDKPQKKKMKPLEDTDDDEESGSDHEPMDVIEKSPYENNLDAEKGVKLFERLKHVLRERKGDEDFRTVNDDATRIFGPKNSWCLVKANALIEKSGMVYSQEWVHGNIRGNQLGNVPKELLILCLVSKRFAKAQDLLLSGLTRDFEVSTIVHEAIKELKIPGDFHKILNTHRNFQFATRKRDCYKCAIFVARAFAGYKALGFDPSLMDSSLRGKIKVCLKLMETHLPEPSAPARKKRKSIDSASAGDVPNVVAAAYDPSGAISTADGSNSSPPKRKRGRPRKNPPPAPKEDAPDNASKDDALLDDESDLVAYNAPVRKNKKRASAPTKISTLENDDDSEDDEDDMVPYNPPSRKPGRKSTGSHNVVSSSIATAAAKNGGGSAKATDSLSQLIAQFEKQYDAMGKIYQEMGLTLKALKSKVEENRSATEEEIRNELLLEVQENLLKSFGKK